MQLQTEIQIKPFDRKLNHANKILMLGSCFAVNIGKRLADAKFNICINPFGVIYNPVSVANSIEILLENRTFTENDLLLHNGLYYSFYFHSLFADAEKQSALTKINNAKEQGHEFIQNAESIMLTFGSSIAYKYIKTNEIVANCHKLPSCEFEKTDLTINEIVNVINTAIFNIRAVNSKANFIFTVSPIRYLSDGAFENQLSKSRLLLAINDICRTNNNCFYFPAYEIMMDELRDYRFYADDMLHPSTLAIDCIWQKFANAAITDESLTIIDEIKKIQTAKMHRAFKPDSEEHKKFLKTYFEKTKQLQQKYPNLNLQDELEYFGVNC
jgi:hypothetical protein